MLKGGGHSGIQRENELWDGRITSRLMHRAQTFYMVQKPLLLKGDLSYILPKSNVILLYTGIHDQLQIKLH